MSKVRIPIVAVAAVLALVLAAPATAAPPTLVGVTPVDVGPGSVRLGIIFDTGGYPGTFRVEYGETTSYTDASPDADVPSERTQVTARMTGLAAAKTYHYRVVATTREGTVTSPDQTITTSVPGAPQLVTRPWVGRQASGAFLCDPGGWSGPAAFTYQWLRDGGPISGATAQSYTATTEDFNHALACRVVASDADRTSFAISDGVAILPAPAVVSRPAIVTPPGSAYAGASIVCDPGQWTLAASFTYTWWRDGVPIPGATNAVYGVTKDDEGRSLMCRVVATANGASVEALSDPLAVRTAVVSCVSCSGTSIGVPTNAAVAKAVKGLARAFAGRRARARLLRRGALTASFALGQPGQLLVEWRLGARNGGARARAARVGAPAAHPRRQADRAARTPGAALRRRDVRADRDRHVHRDPARQAVAAISRS
jgi:hypothetical protein